MGGEGEPTMVMVSTWLKEVSTVFLLRHQICHLLWSLFCIPLARVHCPPSLIFLIRCDSHLMLHQAEKQSTGSCHL